MSDEFKKLTEIVHTLMGEKGCPWDKVQTRESLKPYLVEEVYETLEALDGNNPEEIKEELGVKLKYPDYKTGLDAIFKSM